MDVGQGKANVIIFTNTDCPIANSFIPEINAIARDFAQSPLKFFAVHVDPTLTREAAIKHAKDYSLSIPVVIDSKHKLVNTLGITRTPEVAVILPDGKIAYIGRIDDRYPALGKKRFPARNTDLRNALNAIIKNKKIEVAKTEAIGCSIPDLPEEEKKDK